MTFLIGDSVKLRRDTIYIHLDLNDVYKVTGHNDTGEFIYLNNRHATYRASEFDFICSKGETISDIESPYERGYQQGWHDALVWAGI